MSEASSSSVTDEQADSAKPFLKWAGGKSQLLVEIKKRIPKDFNRYFEPFIGGGAVFFSLQPKEAYISDINPELINCYQAVKNTPKELLKVLRTYPNDKDFFYQIRNADREASFASWSLVERAARLIYLNKTCFNGLYRVNSKGQFNVPFGDYKKPNFILDQNIYACSEALRKTEVSNQPFFAIESKVGKGDFVYFDPPYAPLSLTSNFTAYSKDGFGEEKQKDLRDLCLRLNDKGVLWMVSNSSAALISKLYLDFNIEVVQARRNINSNGAGRASVEEFLIRNYS